MIFFGQIKNEQMELVNGLQLKQFLKKTEGKQIQVVIQERPSFISPPQRASLHLWFTHMAQALNDSGQEIQHILKVDVPYTNHSVKQCIWEPIQKSYLQTENISELQTRDVDQIFDILNRGIGDYTGVNVPWPQRKKIDNQLQLKYS